MVVSKLLSGSYCGAGVFWIETREVLSVPVDTFLEAFLHFEARKPLQNARCLFHAQALIRSFPGSGAEDNRLKIPAAGNAQHHLCDFQNRPAPLQAEVERLP